jgi:uncharacterized protein YjiS (DUF1127 family)
MAGAKVHHIRSLAHRIFLDLLWSTVQSLVAFTHLVALSGIRLDTGRQSKARKTRRRLLCMSDHTLNVVERRLLTKAPKGHTTPSIHLFAFIHRH